MIQKPPIPKPLPALRVSLKVHLVTNGLRSQNVLILCGKRER
jgi:hypothetical protein